MYVDDDSGKKAMIASIVAGIMFGSAWWIYSNRSVDGQAFGSHHTSSAQQSHSQDVQAYSWLPGVGTSIGFLMVNGLHWSHLKDDDGTGRAAKTRIFLIVSIMIMLACVAGSVFIMVDKFLDSKNENAYKWNGIAIFLSNLLIFLAAFVMRFGTLPADD